MIREILALGLSNDKELIGIKTALCFGLVQVHKHFNSHIHLYNKKHKQILLLQNHKAQSFHILYVAMFSGPLYKSCQSCPWGQKWPRPGGH